MIKRNNLKIIEKKMIGKFESVLISISVEYSDGKIKDFIEYYIGVDKNSEAYYKGFNLDISRRVIVEKDENILASIQGKICAEFYDFTKGEMQYPSNINGIINVLSESLKALSLKEDEIADYVKANNLKPLKYAWISMIGNKEDYSEFLNQDYCYYGGGMCVTNFGLEDCLIAATEANEILLKIISKH